MVTTDVELCNHALSYLGESRIEALTESNERSRICNVFYEQTRDELLAMYQWPFAVGRASLAAVSEENLTQYEYKYALPTDYLRLIDLVDPETGKIMGGVRQEPYPPGDSVETWPYSRTGVRYQIEGNRLLTDENPCIIRYTRKIETPGLFPELFVAAFIPSLAAKIAPRLSQNNQLAGQMLALAQNAITRAKSELNITGLTRPPAQVNIAEIN